MKTAEEWDKFFSERYNRKTAPELAAMSQFDFFKDMCNHIQLDAIKEGARRAADCAISEALMNTHDAEGRCICGNCSARRAILTAAEQWTKKDL